MLKAETVAVQVPISADDRPAQVFQAYRRSRSKQATARLFGISRDELDRLLSAYLASFKSEDRLLQIMMKAARIDDMIGKLGSFFDETDDPRLACELAVTTNYLLRTSNEMLGHNEARRTENHLNFIEAQPSDGVQRLRDAIKAVVASRPVQLVDRAKPEDHESERL